MSLRYRTESVTSSNNSTTNKLYSDVNNNNVYSGNIKNQAASSESSEKVIVRTHKSGLINPPPEKLMEYDRSSGSDKASISPVDRRQMDNISRMAYAPLPYKSPRRYIEGDVNIHYRTPIRQEFKEAIPEDELIHRQAEAMRRLYQEEKRRKYLQELQNINARRHMDNFTPSQKSPIALNRYDSFPADLSPQSPKSTQQYTMVAKALYSFQGQTARELSFKKGDIIYIRRQIDKNWYDGEHNAMFGLFPANYVEIITRDQPRQPQISTLPKKPAEGQARAKYNFNAQSAIELSLNKGEIVTLTRRVDDNWFEGRIANRKGIFPVSYVDVLLEIGAHDQPLKPIGAPAAHSLIISPTTPPANAPGDRLAAYFNGNGINGDEIVQRETKTKQNTEVLHVDTTSEPITYRALYKYRPQNNDELELNEGDLIFVLEKCDDGWFVGTSQRTGYFGTFPGNYVERL